MGPFKYCLLLIMVVKDQSGSSNEHDFLIKTKWCKEPLNNLSDSNPSSDTSFSVLLLCIYVAHLVISVSTGLVPVECDREMGHAILLSPALGACCWVLGRELATVPSHTWCAVGWIRNSHSHRASSKQPSWLNTHTRSRYQCNRPRARNATDGKKVWQGHKARERELFFAS